MVDSSNHDNVYSQIGPFEIESFAAAAADDDNTSSSSSSTASAASSASCESPASGPTPTSRRATRKPRPREPG